MDIWTTCIAFAANASASSSQRHKSLTNASADCVRGGTYSAYCGSMLASTGIPGNPSCGVLAVAVACTLALCGCTSDRSIVARVPNGNEALEAIVYYDATLRASEVELLVKRGGGVLRIAESRGGGPLRTEWLGSHELRVEYMSGADLRCRHTQFVYQSDDGLKVPLRVAIATYRQ